MVWKVCGWVVEFHCRCALHVMHHTTLYYSAQACTLPSVLQVLDYVEVLSSGRLPQLCTPCDIHAQVYPNP